MDCVVMKVPASVTDASMRKLGELKMSINASQPNGELNMGFIDATDRGMARIVSDTAYFTDSTYTQNLGKEVREWHLYSKSGDGGDFFLGFKQNIRSLELYSGVLLDLKEVKFCSGLTSLVTRDGTVEGDVSELSTIINQLQRIDIRASNNVYGALNVFSNSSSLTTVILERVKCTGSILNFGNCLGLTQLYVYDSTLMEGDPDDLADLMTQNGRTSGTLQYTSSQNVRTTYTFSENGWTKS